MKCPVCEEARINQWLRGFMVALFLGLLIGFIGGQMYHHWQYRDVIIKALEMIGGR